MRDTGKVNAKHGENVRARPRANSAIFEALPFGATVQIEDQEGNWFRVKTATGIRGYMFKEFITVIPAKAAPPPPPRAPAPIEPAPAVLKPEAKQPASVWLLLFASIAAIVATAFLLFW